MLFGNNEREDYAVLNYLHSQIMMGTGEPWGQRDERLTRAAVTRPYGTAFGQEIYADVFAKAAALVDSIVNRVVFKDGNKRTAVVAAALYLGKNGQVLRVRPDESAAFLSYVVLDHPEITEIAQWLEAHTIGRELARKLAQAF